MENSKETAPPLGEASNAPATPIPTDATQGSPQREATLDQQFAELQSKHAEVSDAYLRARADAENTRRRAEEEMSKARKYAVESFAESLLPVKDSLEAAIAVETASPEQMKEGVHATLRQLVNALERHKVVEISPPAGTRHHCIGH